MNEILSRYIVSECVCVCEYHRSAFNNNINNNYNKKRISATHYQTLVIQTINKMASTLTKQKQNIQSKRKEQVQKTTLESLSHMHCIRKD